ncbi:UDP-2,3-diacylglucosamine diphosphatase LpxI [Rhodobacteraceae bacterium]|nr:UDP-2,3-diacylglucosamine diphosphatase LpxI [Paracoccaceae bacterium]
MLALIAGQGALPSYIAPHAGLIAELKGNAPNVPTDLTFRLEHLGSFITTLREKGATEVCFAGAVRRPTIDPNQIDAATRPLAKRLQATFTKGDDAALQTVLDIFEDAGLTIKGAHEAAPDLLPPTGVLTIEHPDTMARTNAKRANDALQIIGAADIGQGCVAANGQIIAVEAALGTDWMLQSLTDRIDGPGGLFYKAPKPGQDRRVDLPTIGPDTVKAVAAANLHGIAIEASGVMVLDLEATIAEANRLKRFLWVKD